MCENGFKTAIILILIFLSLSISGQSQTAVAYTNQRSALSSQIGEEEPSVDFRGFVQDDELQHAIVDAIRNKPYSHFPGHQYAITSINKEDRWALISIVSLNGPDSSLEHVGAGDSAGLLLANYVLGSGWRVEIRGTNSFSELLYSVPESFLTLDAKTALGLPFERPLSINTVEYKFPWAEGDWGYWNDGWHETTPAVDFGTGGTDKKVLASAGGTITHICRGTLSANVHIQDSDGVTLKYFHIDINQLASGINEGVVVGRGRVLGVLKSGGWLYDDDGCGYAIQQNYNAHVHWVIPSDRSFTADGWTITYPSDTWYSGASAKNPGDSFHSTNIPNYGENPCPQSGGVILYWNANYNCNNDQGDAGYRQRTSTGFQNVNDGSFNDKASSVKVPAGWSVRLYEHENGKGGKVCYNTDISDFSTQGNFPDTSTPINDHVSSMEVYDNTNCGSISQNDWNVEYFNDTNLGSHCNTSNLNEAYVFRDWGNDSPASGCNSDNWSARFSRQVYFQNGTYTFGLGSDDWGRIKLGNDTVVNNWQGAGQHYESRTLSAGWYDVTIEFADTLGLARISAWWWGPGYNIPRENRDPNQWYAHYWGNKDLWWDAIVKVNEGSGLLNHSWNDGNPGFNLPNDRFSSRFERQVYLSCAKYRFHITNDNGVRFWVDGQLKLDQWSNQVGTYDVDVDLLSGNHELKVEHFEDGGEAHLSLDWNQIGGCSDTTYPTGSITAPTAGTVISTCPLLIQAEASDVGSGVNLVEFHAYFDDGWHHLGDDASSPYSLNWDCSSINDQGIWLTIHVIDNAGNETMDPGGYVYITLNRTSDIKVYLPVMFRNWSKISAQSTPTPTPLAR